MDSGCVAAPKMEELLDKARQLIAIFTTIVKKVKREKGETNTMNEKPTVLMTARLASLCHLPFSLLACPFRNQEPITRATPFPF